MNELIKVRKYMEQFNMAEKGESVIVGISGGADSVCLYKILLELKKYFDIDIIAVHIHHGIRGDEADRDMNFVENMCKNDGVKFKCYKYNVPEYAKANGLSEEEAGRTLRYKAFDEVAKELISNGRSVKIAVAHNRNDSAETFIHNLCRGSGLKGLAGIPYKNGSIIRPVLCLTREEIERYLSEHNIAHIDDSTNFTEDYTRNKIRHRVLPYLNENINDNSISHICQAADELREIEDYLSEITNYAYENIVSEHNNCIYINRKALADEKEIIQKRVVRVCIEKAAGKLKDITRKHIEDVIDLCDRQTGRYIMLPYGIIARVQYENIILERENINKIIDEKNIEKDIRKDGVYTLGDEEFDVRIIDVEKEEINIKFLINQLKNYQNLYTKCFDYDKIQFTVQLRYRESEDYLVINAKGQRKKLKSFFVDNKIPAEKRGMIPVFADGSHIIWIVGHRISEEYKVTEDTRHLLIISRLERKENQNAGQNQSID
ncbi:MAG: tRNA lysidine(34) synthetase TilS [Clostridiales bacterium]|nr:tRNA lysidine(34) synthetase TilS [Clostridiales bacterium]MDD6293229.1 tRNA lysidine(34) synthetase TilS [Eubacteriales bacterium]